MASGDAPTATEGHCVTGSNMNHDVSARPLAKGATLHLRSTRKMLKTRQCPD